MFRSIGHSFLILALASICTTAIAQEKPSESSRGGKAPAAKSSSSKSAAAKSTTTGKELTGRLPRFFASLVDQEQRDEIYQVRATFREKLEALEQELADLKEAEMSAMEKVLTTTQRQKLTELRASAEKATKAKTASASSSAKSLATKSSAEQ